MCGVCGEHLDVERAEDALWYYVCVNDDCCQVWVSVDDLDAAVMAQVLARLAGAGIRAPASPEQIADVNERLAGLDRDYAAGNLDRREYLLIRREVYLSGEELRRRADQGAAGLEMNGELTADTFKRWWVTASIEKNRELLTLLLEHVKIHPADDPNTPHIATSRVTCAWRTY